MDTVKQQATTKAATQTVTQLAASHKKAQRRVRRYRRLSWVLIAAFWVSMLAAIWTDRHLAFALTGLVLAALTVYSVGSCIIMGFLNDAIASEIKKRDQVTNA